jgi:hypothetical protein
MYSTAFEKNDQPEGTIHQVVSWTNFIGNGIFCLKICEELDLEENYCEK